MGIKLSVAIVTRNRPESLERTLRSLIKQSPQPYEVIISDDSTDGAMIRLNKAVVSKYGYKYINGPTRGLYANRNFVANNCTGTHIRSMDDDHEFPDHHLKICVDKINECSKVIWTIGEYSSTQVNRSLPAPFPGQLSPRGYSYRPEKGEPYYGISCGATIYPKEVIDKGILNYEIYKFGIMYLEYGVRLYHAGYTLRHLDQTYVIHHDHDANASIATSKSRESLNVIYSAQIFCMLMFSFHHQRSIKNRTYTILEIAKQFVTGKYLFENIINAYKNYSIESGKLLKLN